MPTIDYIGRATDNFVRGADEKKLSDEVTVEEDDDVPVIGSWNPLTDNRSQQIDDKDPKDEDYEVAKLRRIGKSVIDILAEDNDAPASFETTVKPDTTMPGTTYIHHHFLGNPLYQIRISCRVEAPGSSIGHRLYQIQISPRLEEAGLPGARANIVRRV